jgi:hypothetical protein
MRIAKLIPVLAGALLILPNGATSQTPSPLYPVPVPFVTGLWEHKIEVTVPFPMFDEATAAELTAEDLVELGMASIPKADQSLGSMIQNPHLREWQKGGLHEVRQAANDQAVRACNWYNRDAYGPVYESYPDTTTIILTYACGLR